MARVLTGIQSTGVPHLGNLLGAIIPAIKISQNSKNESLFFIADLHSFTTVRDKKVLQENTYATAAAWLAFGFDTKKNLFYRQSDVPQVCELTWYLNCFTPFPMLANAHSFKDKSDRLSDVNFEQIIGLEFEFGCGKNYSINELANMFGESYPKKYIPARDGEMRETLCESKKERDLLDWEPTHDLETYIKTLIGDSK